MSVRLTPKEIDCLFLAGRRLSDAEIAHRLDVSLRTVSNHLSRAYAKLGVHDRIRAAAKMSNLYPEYPLPIGFEPTDGPSSPPSVQRSAAGGWSLAKAFAALPPPPSRVMRLVLILAVASSIAFVFAGVTVIMSVSTDRAATYAPPKAR